MFCPSPLYPDCCFPFVVAQLAFVIAQVERIEGHLHRALQPLHLVHYICIQPMCICKPQCILELPLLHLQNEYDGGHTWEVWHIKRWDGKTRERVPTLL